MSDQPTPITMDEAMKEAYAHAEPKDIFFDTLTFTSDGEKLSVVCSDVAVPYFDSQKFHPCPFNFRLPTTESKIVGALEIELPFLPQEAMRWLVETSMRGGRISVVWKQYLCQFLEDTNGGEEDQTGYEAISPTSPQLSAQLAPLEIISVERTPTGAVATATVVDLVNTPFPRKLMLTEDLPGGVL